MSMTENELATQKAFTRIEGKLGKIESSTERTEKAIFGNGREGLLERVAKLETKVGVIAGIAGAVTGIIGGCVSEIIKHLF